MDFQTIFAKGYMLSFQPIDPSNIIQLESFLIMHYLPDDPLFNAIGSDENLREAQKSDSQLNTKFIEETKEFLHTTFIGPSFDSHPMVSFKVICESTGELVAVSLANIQYLDDKEEHKTYIITRIINILLSRESVFKAKDHLG